MVNQDLLHAMIAESHRLRQRMARSQEEFYRHYSELRAVEAGIRDLLAEDGQGISEAELSVWLVNHRGCEICPEWSTRATIEDGRLVLRRLCQENDVYQTWRSGQGWDNP